MVTSSFRALHCGIDFIDTKISHTYTTTNYKLCSLTDLQFAIINATSNKDYNITVREIPTSRINLYSAWLRPRAVSPITSLTVMNQTPTYTLIHSSITLTPTPYLQNVFIFNHLHHFSHSIHCIITELLRD